jgi:hypothetical protein
MRRPKRSFEEETGHCSLARLKIVYQQFVLPLIII